MRGALVVMAVIGFGTVSVCGAPPAKGKLPGKATATGGNRTNAGPHASGGAVTPGTGQMTGGSGWNCPRNVYDFGEVWQGTIVTYNFEIRNTGHEDIDVLGVTPESIAIVPGSYQRRIAAGATAYLPFSLVTTGLSDRFVKGATIRLSDARAPLLQVRFQGTIKTVLTLKPADVGQFGDIADPKAAVTHEAEITSNVSEPVKLEPVPMGRQPFTATLKEVEKGKRWHLTIKTSPPLMAGYLQTPFQFKTNHPKLPVWIVTANGLRAPRIAAEPVAVRLPEGTASGPLSVNIVNHGATPFKVLKAEVQDAAGLTAEVQPKGNDYRVTISTAAGSEWPERAKLVVTTDDKEIKELRVTLYKLNENPEPPAPVEKGAAGRPAATQPGSTQPATIAPERPATMPGQ